MVNFNNLGTVPTQGVVPVTVIAAPKKMSELGTNIFWSLVRKAKRDFVLCPTELKSNDAKFMCLRKYFSQVPDVQKVFADFMSESKKVAEMLEDKLSVVKACADCGTDVKILATHVVFLGKTAIQKVVKYGVGEQSPIFGHLELYKEPFLPDNIQDFVNKEWLPSKGKKMDEQSAN